MGTLPVPVDLKFGTSFLKVGRLKHLCTIRKHTMSDSLIASDGGDCHLQEVTQVRDLHASTPSELDVGETRVGIDKSTSFIEGLSQSSRGLHHCPEKVADEPGPEELQIPSTEPVAMDLEEEEDFLLNDVVCEDDNNADSKSQIMCTSKYCVPVEEDFISMPLPSGWIGILHECGAFVYCHQATRVICWSRPYAIGKTTSVRRHRFPSFAIPCLHQKMQKKRERRQKVAEWMNKMTGAPGGSSENDLVTDNEHQSSSSKSTHDSSILTTASGHKLTMITSNEMNDYLKNAFELQPLGTKQWKQVTLYAGECPKAVVLPEILKEIPQITEVSKSGNCVWSTNAAGKSSVVLLNEYCQRSLKACPQYSEFKTASSANGFAMEVIIDKMNCGYGYGQSKKIAKHKAAEQALAILLPGQYSAVANFEVSDEHLKLFDTMKITDDRIYSCVSKLNLPTPCKILQMCFDRHHGNDNMPSYYKFQRINRESTESTNVYEMVCGDYKTQGTFKNKLIARQACAQRVLQYLHPHISMWGSVMRLYSQAPSKIILEPKNEGGLSRLGLTDKASNEEVLDALKKEMRALAGKTVSPNEDYPNQVKRFKEDVAPKKKDKSVPKKAVINKPVTTGYENPILNAKTNKAPANNVKPGSFAHELVDF